MAGTVWLGVGLADSSHAQMRETGDATMRGAVVQGVDGSALASYICGDVGIGLGLSLVGCGAASDLFAVTPAGGELSHYRLERGFTWLAGAWSWDVIFGAGMAEAQWGQDAAGFYLANEDLSTVEAAGGELMVGMEVWAPAAWRFVDMRLRLDGGVAWLPGWQEVGGNREDVLPFGVLTANGSF